jgi:hypothetical protein
MTTQLVPLLEAAGRVHIPRDRAGRARQGRVAQAVRYGGIMITQDEVIPLLLAACPGFEPAWREHLEWWGDQERGIYNDTAAFATYIIDSYGSGHTAEFDLAFAALERILAQGDENARAAASIGALESIQVQSTHYPFGPTAFLPWLGPKSREAWDSIEALWEAGGGSLMGVVRLERDLADGRVGGPIRWWQFWRR